METAEKIDVLDDCGIRTGEVLSKQEVHKLGKVHRAVHLYLFDCSNRLLLQRRSPTTDHLSRQVEHIRHRARASGGK